MNEDRVAASVEKDADDVVYRENRRFSPGEDVGVRARLVEPFSLQLIVKPLRRLELGVEAIVQAVVR